MHLESKKVEMKETLLLLMISEEYDQSLEETWDMLFIGG